MVAGNRHRISVRSLGVEVSAAPTETILEALVAAGADYPHGCTSGVCGLCKSRLIAGRAELADYTPALNAAERDAGMTLPCCATPLEDCVIAPVHDGLLPRVTTLDAEIVELRPLTHDVRLVRLGLAGGARFDFLPGQYASLGFADLPARDFSFAQPSGGDTLEFFIRRVADGAVTGFVFDRLRLGDRVRVKGPYGTAYLREAHLGPILAVAGGSGLAPIRSIVRTALEHGFRQEIRLYFGVRSPRDLFMEEELAGLAESHSNLSFEVAYSEAEQPSARGGMLHEVLRRDFAAAGLASWRAYVAGPPLMVDAVARVLRAAGLPDDSCHVDPFLTAADRARVRTTPERRAS
jgi:CDP-4-dehydro-6-deoxyglucose reductase/ferredoxin-NAD(P)+ reductase (naphthalene dioxygenase ferredoxin-specific)